jgi:hypothetical protein
VLALGALVFGIGMTVSGSCISAHLYRLGEGSPTAPFALGGAAAGFALGFLSWNDLYHRAVQEALSGIFAGALSGWVFAIFCFLGMWLSSLAARRLSGVP